MSNIDKFITNNLVEELDNKAAEVVSGGNRTPQAYQAVEPYSAGSTDDSSWFSGWW